MFNVDASAAGYTGLDDGDQTASNNPTIKITADTYIYGYWTVTELKPSSAHVSIEKVFIVDGVEKSLKDAEDLWFRIDTGYDSDLDGESEIDVDYSMITAADGEYKIPVYQYDLPFVFTEHNAEVAGYTRSTTIRVTGDYVVSSNQNGDSVSVVLSPVYTGENVHLATVTYTNTYTKKTGDAINVYPSMTLVKSAADTFEAQDGVVFTLYQDEDTQTALKEITTADGGLASVDFTGLNAGTYYLKETSPLSGYVADPNVYQLTLSASEPEEELRNNEYVSVTYYTVSVTVPEDSTASYSYSETSGHRLHIYNAPVLGSLNLKKTIAGIDEADLNKVDADVVVHGPITRDAQGNITAVGSTWRLELNSANEWNTTLSELGIGEYLIHESFASVHGYTWTDVQYGQLETVVYNNITSGVFEIKDETAIDLTLENTYEKWTAADFYIKKVNEKNQALGSAEFTLSTDEAGLNVVDTKTTGVDGYAYFGGYTVPEGQTSVTYYLKETKAPAGYYLSEKTYKVEIKTVDVDGKTAYEPDITLIDGTEANFDGTHDLLTVVNSSVLGQLTVTKAFTDGIVPDGLTQVSVQVGGPDGYLKVVDLNNENGWSAVLSGLALGEYTISELDAQMPGYDWSVAYSSSTITLSEENPGKTASQTNISETVTVTNTYTQLNEFIEIPAVLTVKKVGENQDVLAGAVFTLDRYNEQGTEIINSVSFTTGENGIVVFNLLSGFVDGGTITNGKYVLSETKAPEGYEKTEDTWTVTVEEDDGNVRIVLNENKNVFENFWDWIVGDVNPSSWEDGILTVQNRKKTGSLLITKTVEDSQGYFEDAEYSFTVDFSDDTLDQTFTLKAGETKEIKDIPWGTTYQLIEDTTDAAFISSVEDAGEGLIWAETTTIDVVNTYHYVHHNEGLNLVKVDAFDNTKVIEGAGFTLYADETLQNIVAEEVLSDEYGAVYLPIEEEGTYYLKETTTPDGYYSNDVVYQVTAELITEVINAGTTEAAVQLQMHIQIAQLEGTTENQIDYVYKVENTPIQQVIVTVEKVWDDHQSASRPKSVEVVLLRDGEVYETVTLNHENEWSYAWTELTDEHSWSVDEINVPSGYTKKVTSEGHDFTITNTKTVVIVEHDVPDTSDLSSVAMWAALNVSSLLMAVMLVLMKKRAQKA